MLPGYSCAAILEILLQVACVVHSAYIDDLGEHVYLATTSANVVPKSVLISCLPAGKSFIDLMFEKAANFNAFQLSSSQTALFSALILICPGTDIVIPLI